MTPGKPTGFWLDRSVAVTGATGFIGAHVTGALVEAGAVVTILVRDDVPSNDIVDGWRDKVNIVRGACEDAAVVQRMLGEYEVRSVLHLAAQSQVRVANDNPLSTFEANIAGTWALLEGCRRTATVEEVALASSDKAYGSQPTLPYTEDMPLLAHHPYDVSKACGDMLATTYANTYGLNVCITRCGNFFGPGDRNWDRLIPGTYRSLVRGQQPIIRSDGSMIRDYLYAVDGALLYLGLVEAMHEDDSLRGEAFNFSSGRPMSVLEMLALIQESVGTDLEPDILGVATGEIDEQHLSSEKARRVLGWKPQFTIEDALAHTAAWYRTAVLV